jgi:hypothetical protein
VRSGQAWGSWLPPAQDQASTRGVSRSPAAVTPGDRPSQNGAVSARTHRAKTDPVRGRSSSEEVPRTAMPPRTGSGTRYHPRWSVSCVTGWNGLLSFFRPYCCTYDGPAQDALSLGARGTGRSVLSSAPYRVSESNQLVCFPNGLDQSPALGSGCEVKRGRRIGRPVAQSSGDPQPASRSPSSRCPSSRKLRSGGLRSTRTEARLWPLKRASARPSSAFALARLSCSCGDPMLKRKRRGERRQRRLGQRAGMMLL